MVDVVVTCGGGGGKFVPVPQQPSLAPVGVGQQSPARKAQPAWAEHDEETLSVTRKARQGGFGETRGFCCGALIRARAWKRAH